MRRWPRGGGPGLGEVGAMALLPLAPISPGRLAREGGPPECGGTCAFLGTVRNGPDEKGVTAIEYSAYQEMVEGELGRIVAEAAARWPGGRLALRHRLGVIRAGEASIAIVAAAPHRAPAFEACRYAIEEIKRRVPVWKKELRSDGGAVWGEPSGRPTSKPAHV